MTRIEMMTKSDIAWPDGDMPGFTHNGPAPAARQAPGA
jgi:hypothetical protein